MSLTINTLRVSFLWVETFSSLLEEPQPDAPMASLGRASTFAEQFDKAKLRQSPHALVTPWPKLSGQHFWHYYLGKRIPDEMKGSQAWKTLVPLRFEKLPMPLDVAPAARVAQEGFVYPFGIAYVVTIDISGEYSLAEAVEVTHAIRYTPCVTTGAPDANATTLREAAIAALTWLRQRVLGPGAVTGMQSAEPFTIVTIIEGHGRDAAPLVEGGEEHRVLEAFADWSATWRTDSIPDLQSRRVAIRRESDTRILYASKSGRVVWFPALFQHSQADKRVHTLGCYHRSLMLVSLQVESLIALITMVRQRIENRMPMPAALNDCARFAGGILGRLHGGDDSTYRTESARTRLLQTSVKRSIDAVRTHYGMAHLA